MTYATIMLTISNGGAAASNPGEVIAMVQFPDRSVKNITFTVDRFCDVEKLSQSIVNSLVNYIPVCVNSEVYKDSLGCR